MSRNKSSWDRRYWNSDQSRDEKPYSTESNIGGFSAVETLNGLRGLATLLRDIALCPDTKIDKQDLLYMADRMDFLCVALEEKVRTKTVAQNAMSQQKPKPKGGKKRKKK